MVLYSINLISTKTSTTKYL